MMAQLYGNQYDIWYEILQQLRFSAFLLQEETTI